jgi:hypothetical protein
VFNFFGCFFLLYIYLKTNILPTKHTDLAQYQVMIEFTPDTGEGFKGDTNYHN